MALIINQTQGQISCPSIQISPFASSLTQGISVTQSAAGSATSSFALNNIAINSDTANCGGFFGSALEVTYNFGGSAMQGGRQGIIGTAALVSTSSASNTNRNYVGVQGVGITAVNDNGTAGMPAGAMFGASSIGGLQTGATHWLNVTGYEFNCFIQAGASAAYKSIVQFSAEVRDRVQGAVVDAMLWLYNQSASNPGWNFGILWDGVNQIWPIAPTGTIIATNAGTAATGIDFSATTLSGSLLKGPNFSIPGPALTQVASPSNANAATAGVPVGGIYTGTADPHALYIRTA